MLPVNSRSSFSLTRLLFLVASVLLLGAVLWIYFNMEFAESALIFIIGIPVLFILVVPLVVFMLFFRGE